MLPSVGGRGSFSLPIALALLASVCNNIAAGPSAPSDDGGLALGSESSSLTLAPEAVEIRFAAYIPCQAVAVPGPARDFPLIGGDNRGPSYHAIPSRSRAAATVRVDSRRPSRAEVQIHPITTRGYRSGSGSGLCRTPTGSPDVVVAAEPLETQGVTVFSRRRSQGDANDLDVVTITLANRNPVTLGAPELELSVSVNIHYERDAANRLVAQLVSWQGVHEGFPAMELYINGDLKEHYDPVCSGANAFELVGTAEHHFDGSVVLGSPCDNIVRCMHGLAGSGADYDRAAALCMLGRGAPASFEGCIRGRGGLGCFDRFADCDAPAPTNGAQTSCVCFRGGVSCFGR